MADYYPVSNSTLILLSEKEEDNGETRDDEYQNYTDENRTYASSGNTTQIWIRNIGQTDTHLPIQGDNGGGGTGGSSSMENTTSTDSDYTIDSDDGTILVDTTSGNINITLPDAGDNNGKIFKVKKVSGDNNIIISPQSGSQIDNQSSYTISNTYDAVGFQSDGTNWYLVDQYVN